MITRPHLALALLTAAAIANPASAQVSTSIVTDGSTGPATTVLDGGGGTYTIDESLGSRPGGGTNLFHSFTTFDLAAGNVADFTAAQPTANVIARVTGGLASTIDGTLRSSVAGADLYFLNPSGVLFGQSASVDVDGSFHVSTADRLRMTGPGGSRLDAFSGDPALATATPSAFGFLGAAPARIAFRGTTLSFGSGEGLTVVGGPIDIGSSDVAVPRTRIALRDARLSIASIGEAGDLAFVVQGDGLELDMDADLAGARVRLDRASAEVSGSVAAAGLPEGIQIQANRIQLRNGSLLAVQPAFTNAGGDVRLRAMPGAEGDPSVLRLTQGSLIHTDSSGSAGGDIAVKDFDKVVLRNQSQIRSDATGNSALSGNLSFTGIGSLRLFDRSEISAGAFQDANSTLPAGASPGSVRIVSDSIELRSGGSIESITVSAGDGGDVDITTGSLLAEGAFIDTSPAGSFTNLTQPSGVSSTIGFAAAGGSPNATGGDVRIRADSITLLNGGRIAAETVSSGTGGNVFVDADQVLVSGVNAELAAVLDRIELGGVDPNLGSVLLQISRDADFSRSAIAASSLVPLDMGVPFSPGGDAGSVDLRIGSLQLTDGGLIAAFTEGAGAGGNVRIAARGDVLLSDAGEISLDSTGTGDAGDVSISAGGLVEIEGSASITTEASQAAGGTVRIDSRVLHLNRGSITTSVATGAGGGGDITLAARLVALNDAVVRANADAGDGGNISISAGNFLATPNAVIDASANTGIDGVVTIDSPEVNVEAGLANLQTEFLAASTLLRPSCAVRGTETESGSFVVAARRGVPRSPEDLIVAFDAIGGTAVVAGTERPGENATLLAQNALRGGDLEGAELGYSRAARELAKGGGTAAQRGASLRSLAQTQQAAGRYAASVETLRSAVVLAETDGDAPGLASALGSLGNAYLALGRGDEAERLLERGIAIAADAEETALEAGLWNNLGNHHAARDRHEAALEAYENAARLAAATGHSLDLAKALSNAAREARIAGQDAVARELLKRATAALDALPDSLERAELEIHQARTWTELARTGSERATDMLAAHALLTQAAERSLDAGATRTASYAVGTLGALYREEVRFDEALFLTRQAMRLAATADAPDSMYRWHWQEGRLLWAQGQADAAVAAYRRAVELLEETRQEAQGRYGQAAAHFSAAVAPVYLELVEVLLASSDRVTPASASSLFVEARGTVERLKAAELRDYFRDDCVAELEAKTATVESVAAQAAVVYPILLAERLELLVTLPDGIHRYSVPVPAARLSATVREFREQLQRPGTKAYQETSRTLHDWLVRPFLADVDAFGLDTLVFVPDGALRTIPIAALHDGERFVSERYSLAVTPSMALVDPRPLDREGIDVLLGGVSESVDGHPALAMVPAELEAVSAMYGGRVLLDGQFELARLEKEIRQSQPTVVHIASHAVFTGDPETSFVLMHDDKLTMGRLASVIGVTRFRERPLEMLVLSACQTAAGNERAGLGLAGVAIRAGARSAMGSLWSISDEAAFRLVESFYEELEDPTISKAEALRRSQARLRSDPRFDHPYYWSPFLIINNWL